jgi:CRISPR-associated protein Cmr4
METRPILVHALSPLHPGTGQATDVVDLPVARSRGTGIPFLPGSSLKGALRALRWKGDPERAFAVFGPDTEHAALHAGALIVGDARLLALPVRSLHGVFARVSSPLLLALANRDLGQERPVPSVSRYGARVAPGSLCRATDGRVYLEDLDLFAEEDGRLQSWTDLLAADVAPPGVDPSFFSARFLVVDDDTMAFVCETALQVDARIRINAETGTVSEGALWLEESLPPETLLLAVLAAERSRRDNVSMTPEEVLDFALPATEGGEVVQLGGNATTGRGRCRLLPVRARGRR